MNLVNLYRYFIVLLFIALLSCKEKQANPYEWKTIEVTATAYNSLAYQTSSNPHITAFGDSLKPGLKYIAVSRDLLKNGLRHNTLVKIEGVEGTYLVKDKMAARWKNKIDIYMGDKVKKAKKWGVKDLSIVYALKKDTVLHETK